VQVAAGNFDGLPGDELIVGPGGGSAGVPVVVYRHDGAVLVQVLAFRESWASGVFVAAGDLDGDGAAELVAGAGYGGLPLVRVFRGRTGELRASLLAYDEGFRGGVRVGVTDRDGDGLLDLVTGAGPLGSPHVRVLDGLALNELDSFLAYDEGFRSGVFV
jgi:hypothetical protein